MDLHGLKAAAGAVAFLLVSHSAIMGLTLTVPGDHSNIVDAVAAAGDGDIIEVSAGTYTELAGPNFTQPNVTLKAVGGEVVLNVPDDVDAAIYISAQNITIEGIRVQRTTSGASWMRSIQVNTDQSLTLVDCVLEGPANGVGVILFNGADLDVSGTTFQNFNPAASFSAAIFLENDDGGFSNLTVDNCVFEAGCNAWIRSFNDPNRLPKVGNIHVTNSVFKAAVYPHGIRFNNGIAYEPGSTVLFEDCEFTGTQLEVVEMHYTGLGGPDSITFRRCLFKAYDSFRRAMYLDTPAPFLFENVMWEGGQHETLIRFWGGAGSPTFNHCTLINDGVPSASAFGGLDSSTIVDGWDNGTRTFTFRNCLLYSPENYTAALFGDWASEDNRNYDLDFTILEHETPVDGFAVLNTGANYSEEAIQFVNAAARDLELQPDSPAVDTGTDLGILNDVLGRPRSHGTGPDMGALELQSGVVIQAYDTWSVY